MASFSDTAFSTSAFSDQAFSFTGGPTPVLVIDTHDDPYKKRREAKSTLREQIRVALEGPKAKELAHELETVASPQVADSVFVPLVDRIDYEALGRTRVAEILEAMREAQAQEEEEIVILMALS